MPLDVNCPKCAHVFPVTEAKHPFGVQCPGCDAELTAEFRRLPVPVPGQPHYELFVTTGRPPGTPPALPAAKKPMALDDEEGKGQKGGSMAMVFVAGIGALLVTLGGLAATGYVLFFTDFGDEPERSYSRSGSSSTGRPNTNNTRPTPNNNNNNPRPDPRPEPPKKVDKFDYRPVRGAVPPITPPPNLPAAGNTLELDLGGKVGAVTVAGGGRYIVVHIPDRGLLGLYDASQGRMVAAGDTERGNVYLAGGLDRVVVVSEVAGKKKLQSYSLPNLRQEFETNLDMFFGPRGAAMGNRTNGPVLVWDPFGELFLYELDRSGATLVEGAKKKMNPGIYSNHGLAFPDGSAFVTYDGPRDPHVRVLSHDTRKRDWEVDNTRFTPFPGNDGLLYGKGVVNDKNGRDARFGGVATNAGWLVPATTGGGYFLKLAPVTVPDKPRPRNLFTVTFHSNRNAGTPIPGTPTLSGSQDLNEFGDFTANLHGHVPANEHFFLIPEAKSLVILNMAKTKLILRRADLR